MLFAKLLTIFITVLFSLLIEARTYGSGGISVEVISDSGDLYRVIPHRRYVDKRGTNVTKQYLEAIEGDNYSIVVSNNTGDRIGVVVAVDGRNVISGDQSYLKNTERMYVIPPYENVRIDGWRTSQDVVNRFYFTVPEDSYSVRTFGDDSAMGVIAVAAFREKTPVILERKAPAPTPAPKRKSMLKGFGTAPSDRQAQTEGDNRVGTGFGEEQYSPTRKVQFDPEPVAFSKVLVKYEWHETLCKRGLVRCYEYRKHNRLWDGDRDRYAPYPPDR